MSKKSSHSDSVEYLNGKTIGKTTGKKTIKTSDIISDKLFKKFQKLVSETTGIHISDNKKLWLIGRLSQRLRNLDCLSFSDYFDCITKIQWNKEIKGNKINKDGALELQAMLDLLTTNETYFFREPAHFSFLRDRATCHRKGSPFRVWSAASSSGEEAYTMAMVLAETLGDTAWEILGTDICTKVLAKAESGHYSLARTDGIPSALLKKYCRKGIREQEGTLLITKELRKRVRFLQSNLMNPGKNFGEFDVIFLRNVMIYFKDETKRQVIANLIPYLKPGGHFVIGHCESLHQITTDLVAERPTIYRRSGVGT